MRSIHRGRKERREEGKRNIREFRPRFRPRFRFAAARILKSSFAPRTIETRRTNAWPISRKAWYTRVHHPVPPSSHDTRRSVGRFLDIFEPPPTTLQTGRFTRTREDVRGWGEDEGEDRALSPVDDVRRLVDREREEPDGTRNGAISRRLHSDKALNALMGRPIETSHLTSSASALVALYGLLLFASTSEHRPDRPFRYLPLCPWI